MAKSTQIIETQAEIDREMMQNTLREVHDQLSDRNFKLEVLQEKLSQMDLMLENQGWSSISEYGQEGPSLVQVKRASAQIRNLVALNTWIKRGFRLRQTYIWDGNIHYENIPDKDDRRTRQSNVQALIDLPQNQKYFFGHQAREERESALYSDSQALYLGDDRTKLLRPLYFGEITADYRNPDDGSEIWAYRRSWNHYPQGTVNPEVRNEWYFRHAFWHEKTTSIKYGGVNETVNQDVRVFGEPVNSQIGWAYGIPDALAAIAWVKLYRDFLVNGFTVTAAMAQIWAVAKQHAQSGADTAKAVLGGGGVGQVALMGAGNQLTPLSTAGQAYDFEKGRTLIAAAASAVEVSAIAMTSDTSVAGSSYGSALTLDLPTQLAMQARRNFHIDLDTEVLKWMGADDPKVWFTPYTDPTQILREVQAINFKWNTGLYEAEEIKKMYEALEGRYGEVDVPTGVLLPNNEQSLARRDIDSDGSPGVGIPGQGQNSPAGEGPRSDDMRDDVLS